MKDYRVYICIDKGWFNDYNPTREAVEINRKRIAERS